MLPATGTVFVGVNETVTDTDGRPAMRSDVPMVIVIVVTCVYMPPEKTSRDGSTSADVSILTETAPVVTEPMVKPAMVTVNAAEGMVTPDVVMTTDVGLVELQEPVRPATLLLPATTLGVTDGTKNAEGYEIVILPPGGMGLAGVNCTVRGTFGLPDTRSVDGILKTTSDIGGKMPPEAMAGDTKVSAEV